MKKSGRCNISFEEAKLMLLADNSILLVDVKSKDEYNKGHISRSINIPLSDLKIMIPRIVKNKNQKIILYCSSGVRSLAGCEILRNMGYYNVYNIVGEIRCQL